MKKYPDVTLKMILKHSDKILILRHRNGTYDFPGGQVKWNEELFDALKRELREELNYQLEEHPRLFHIWNYISKPKKRHSVMVYFIYDLDKIYDFVPETDTEILWLTKDEMKSVVRDSDFVERMYRWKDPQTPRSLFYSV